MFTPQQLYERLTDEEDARVCKDIPDDACAEVPGNFLLILLSQFLTKLGDAIASPKVVLPWVMNAISSPLYLIAFLVPIRESGSLIPQLFIASYVRRMPTRKWAWVVGSVVQALALIAMGLVAMLLQGAFAGWLLIALLVVFSLARGLCSVAAKDVTGKTIPKTKRGQLTGWSASAAGLVSVAIGVGLLLSTKPVTSPLLFGVTIMLAGLLWVAAAVAYGRVREFSGATEGGGNAIEEAMGRLRILRTDAVFRRFVVTRSFLLCSALTAPFFVSLAQQRLGSPAYLLGLFIAASGLASLLSAPFWGRVADWSSRTVMIVAALFTSAIAVVVFAVDLNFPEVLRRPWFLPLAYFVLTIAHDGVRVGRKTYIIDLAGGARRTDYVAVSNTVIGIVLLIMGFVGALSEVLTTTQIILVLALFGLAGAAMGRTLPEVE